jgi:hypothetical protein
LFRVSFRAAKISSLWRRGVQQTVVWLSTSSAPFIVHKKPFENDKGIYIKASGIGPEIVEEIDLIGLLLRRRLRGLQADPARHPSSSSDILARTDQAIFKCRLFENEYGRPVTEKQMFIRQPVGKTRLASVS